MHKLTSRPLLLFAALASAALLAACGGSSPQSAFSPAALHSDGLKFSQCMRANGVSNFPDPGSTGGVQINQSSNVNGGSPTTSINGVEVNSPDFHTASAKCQHLMPQPPPLSAAQVARIRAQGLKLAQCMRAHGVNFADPDIQAGPGGRGIQVKIGGGGPGSVDPQSPAFQSAMRACGNTKGHGFGIQIAAP
jgi:hypothetical protein